MRLLNEGSVEEAPRVSKRAQAMAVVSLAVCATVILAASLSSSGTPEPRCTAFTPRSAAHSTGLTVEWQFRLCATDERRGAQLRFHNPGTGPVAFTFRLFTSDVHGCETADDLSSVLTGSAHLAANASTPWPYPTVRLVDDEYRGRLWLCVFDAARINGSEAVSGRAPARPVLHK